MAVRRSKKKTPMAVSKKKKAAKKPVSELKKRSGGGRPLFNPTDEQRSNVEALVGYGLTHKQIASLIRNPDTNTGISQNTLERHFREELNTGAAKTTAKVANSLVGKAISKTHPQSATCAIFYLKCKAHWRQEDRVVHEIQAGTGVLIAPASVSPEDWIEAAESRNNGREPPNHRD